MRLGRQNFTKSLDILVTLKKIVLCTLVSANSKWPTLLFSTWDHFVNYLKVLLNDEKVGLQF
jgi:hypothetical protein